MESSAQAPAALPGLAGSLAVSLISLVVVCLLAYVALWFLRRRGGLGRARGPVRIVAKCPLEPRRSLYLVEAVGRHFLIGVGDGPMTTLADLGALDLGEGRASMDSSARAHEPARAPGPSTVPLASTALDRALRRGSSVR